MVRRKEEDFVDYYNDGDNKTVSFSATAADNNENRR